MVSDCRTTGLALLAAAIGFLETAGGGGGGGGGAAVRDF